MQEGGRLAQASLWVPRAHEWIAVGLSGPLVLGDNGRCAGVGREGGGRGPCSAPSSSVDSGAGDTEAVKETGP